MLRNDFSFSHLVKARKAKKESLLHLRRPKEYERKGRWARGRKALADYIQWLKQHSMLRQAQEIALAFSGQHTQWQNPYALPRPQEFLAAGSVWFTLYPAAFLGRPGDSLLHSLADPELLRRLREIGIEAIHTGPLKRAGSVVGKAYQPTVDGHFDRIELSIDASFGTLAEYQALVEQAKAQDMLIIDDLVPGHTGKGADFRLAERGIADFPGLYAMVEIQSEDWHLLPAIPLGQDSCNLSPDAVETLQRRGYLVGPLDTVVFANPGIKESNWSATAPVLGTDGRVRRWVYLHFFKEGQPSLNWLDPSFAAQRLLAGDMLHSLHILGVRAVRLDATMFLGMELQPGQATGWLTGHPLSVHTTQTVAMMIRKFGGYSFQELNIDLDKIRESLGRGPELSYDFTTRPGYLYALTLGDSGPLRLLLREMLKLRVRPLRLVHALQNHDELMLEATHLKRHAKQLFEYEGLQVWGERLFERLYQEPLAIATGDKVPYNEPHRMSPGICTTLAGLAAAALGIRDLATITPKQISKIRDMHLAAAAFNALQPGAFAISGWDLVGALPIPKRSISQRLADADYRWLNRGAYDLTGAAGNAPASAAGLPRASTLYGTLPDQLRDPRSFASRLKEMLALRQRLKIAEGRLVSVPHVVNPGAVVLVIKVACGHSAPIRLQITAVNFSQFPAQETVPVTFETGESARAIFSTQQGGLDEEAVCKGNRMAIPLQPFEAKLITIGNDPSLVIPP